MTGASPSGLTMQKMDTMNKGAGGFKPSRKTGTAHPSLSSFSPSFSSFSSKSEPGKHVAAMLKIKAGHPEASAAVQGTVDYMTGQHRTTGFLSSALASIRAEMKALSPDPKLEEEAELIISTMQSGIITALDLRDVGGGVADSAMSPLDGAAGPTTPPFSFTSSPSSSSSPSSFSSSSPFPAAAPTAREENVAELRGSLKGVCTLQNYGKTEAARDALAAIPGGREPNTRPIDNDAKAMEGLLLERGGLFSVRRILDQFFGRPATCTAMSEDPRERAQPYGQKAIQDMIGGAKACFTGTLATRGRRTDLGRYVFYGAVAAAIPEKVREDKQVQAVMRLAGLRHNAIIKAAAMRIEMGERCCGWTPMTTAGHYGAVDYPPLDKWLHSSAVSTEDNEVKKQVRVNESTDEETKVYSYGLHNRRYLNAKPPVLHRNFSGSP